MAYKIKVDQNICIGCSTCSKICGENFALDEKIWKAYPKKDLVEEVGKSKEAEEECPVGAISIKEIEAHKS